MMNKRIQISNFNIQQRKQKFPQKAWYKIQNEIKWKNIYVKYENDKRSKSWKKEWKLDRFQNKRKKDEFANIYM